MNGLGQACAMLLAQAKGDEGAHRLLYNHLQEWLCGPNRAAVYPNGSDLMKAVIGHGQARVCPGPG